MSGVGNVNGNGDESANENEDGGLESVNDCGNVNDDFGNANGGCGNANANDGCGSANVDCGKVNDGGSVSDGESASNCVQRVSNYIWWVNDRVQKAYDGGRVIDDGNVGWATGVFERVNWWTEFEQNLPTCF